MVANIVKIDTRVVAPETIAEQTAVLRKAGVKLLAQKVETHEAYEQCKQLGFDYYQGYFFCRPQIVSQRKILADRLSILNLLAKLQDPQITIDELELAVGQTLGISYRILRYLNSPLHGLTRKVTSLRHGIALVGTRMISNWASMMLLESIDDKPRELMITTIARAHMCRQLGVAMRQRNMDQFFTVGLLSLIDAVTDRPMAEVLDLLPLVDDVKTAILDRAGIMGTALKCVEAYEQCNWEQAKCGDLS